MRERLVLSAYTAGWRIVRLLPERMAYLTFSVIAQFVWLRQGRRVRQLEASLSRVMPTASAIRLKSMSRKGMHSYMRYWCDTFRMSDWNQARLLATCRVVGDEPVRKALADKRGVVMALGHLGNWDHAGAWSAVEMAPVTTVAERVRPEELFQRFLDFRQRLGMEVIPLTGGGDPFRILVRRLRSGGFVALLVDRDLSATGVPVTLFGETVRMATGPANLALVTGAALFPVTIHYERLPPGAPARWGIVVEFHDEVEPPPEGSGPEKSSGPERIGVMTQACADALASGISRFPQDWHMLQPVFVADLVPDPYLGGPGGPVG